MFPLLHPEMIYIPPSSIASEAGVSSSFILLPSCRNLGGGTHMSITYRAYDTRRETFMDAFDPFEMLAMAALYCSTATG